MYWSRCRFVSSSAHNRDKCEEVQNCSSIERNKKNLVTSGTYSVRTTWPAIVRAVEDMETNSKLCWPNKFLCHPKEPSLGEFLPMWYLSSALVTVRLVPWTLRCSILSRWTSWWCLTVLLYIPSHLRNRCWVELCGLLLECGSRGLSWLVGWRSRRQSFRS